MRIIKLLQSLISRITTRQRRHRLTPEYQHAAKTLAKAQKLTEKAYSLICKSGVDRDLLEFNCTVSWRTGAKELLNKLSDQQPENVGKEVLYHWRGAEFFGVPVGMCTSLHGTDMCSPK